MSERKDELNGEQFSRKTMKRGTASTTGKERVDNMECWNEGMLHEFAVYKFVAWPVGTWPVNNNKYFSTFRGILVAVVQMLMLINVGRDMIEDKTADINVAIDRFALLACAFLTIVKILLLRWHQDKLSAILAQATNDWSTIVVRHYRDTMLSYADLGRFIFFAQMISSYFAAFSMALTPLTLPDIPYPEVGDPHVENGTKAYTKILPLGTNCFYNEGDVTFCKNLYVLQTVQLLTTTTGNLGSDVFIYGLALHICGQLDILGYDMSQSGTTDDVNFERKRMVELIRKHHSTLDLADKLEVSARHILLAQLFLNAVHICLLGFQLICTLRIRNYILLARVIIALGILMMQLFLYCYMGESLSSKSEAIIQAIYLSDWYTLPANIIKDFSFVIARASVPFRITAGTFYRMDLNNFKNILKASASYVSVLQLMFEGRSI